MNYRRGLNRVFFALSTIWVLFVLVGVPVVVQLQFLNWILSDQKIAARNSANALMASDEKMKRYWDDIVKLRADEYSKMSSFPAFYKQLLGKEGVAVLLMPLSESLTPLGWLTAPVLFPLIAIAFILPAILETPGWLIMLILMFLPPGLAYVFGWAMAVTLRWVVLGFRGSSSHIS